MSSESETGFNKCTLCEKSFATRSNHTAHVKKTLCGKLQVKFNEIKCDNKKLKQKIKHLSKEINNVNDELDEIKNKLGEKTDELMELKLENEQLKKEKQELTFKYTYVLEQQKSNNSNTNNQQKIYNKHINIDNKKNIKNIIVYCQDKIENFDADKINDIIKTYTNDLKYYESAKSQYDEEQEIIKWNFIPLMNSRRLDRFFIKKSCNSKNIYYKKSDNIIEQPSEKIENLSGLFKNNITSFINEHFNVYYKDVKLGDRVIDRILENTSDEYAYCLGENRILVDEFLKNCFKQYIKTYDVEKMAL